MATKRQYKEALKLARGSMAEAGRILGVSRQAVWQYCDRHPEVEKVARDQMDIMLDNAERFLHERVENNELESIKLACRYYGHRRGLVERKELTGGDGQPLISEGTTVKADTALLVHTDAGQKFLELITGLDTTKLIPSPPGDESD